MNEKFIIDKQLIDIHFIDNTQKPIYETYKKEITHNGHHINRLVCNYNLILSNLHAALITRQVDFNVDLYRKIAKETENMSLNELIKHYIVFRKEKGAIDFTVYGSLFKINKDFDVNVYKNVNSDLIDKTDMDLVRHYMNHGVYECRITNMYDTMCFSSNKKEFYKIMFRRICVACIPEISKYKMITIKEGSYLEAVFIEFRILPHTEFLIRNTILLLGDKWSHTIVCGNLNYSHMVNLCSTINKNIKIIKLDYDNLLVEQYSILLTSPFFWNLFIGEKILIYQEDSMIFNKNIEDFLSYDYIGAPWSSVNKYNNSNVGNGGFSLRSKQVMLEIINTISLFKTGNNKTDLLYEDIYFTKNMEDFNIGKLADKETASKFSTELILNENSLGGHCFWLSDNNWHNRIRSVFNILNNNFNYALVYICHNQPSFDMIKDQLKFTNCYAIIVGHNIPNNFYGHENKIIIAKNLENNIEHENKLLTFTAWYAIIKNNLFSNFSHICLLEYDICFENHVLYNMNKLIEEHDYEVISFLGGTNYFKSNCDLNVFKLFINTKNILSFNINALWYYTTNHCIKRTVLEDFVDWYYPDCFYLKKADTNNFSYYHERLFNVYIRHFNKKCFLLNEPIKHLQLCSHGIKK